MSSARHAPTIKTDVRETDMFAVTARLLLRPGWVEDAPALARAIGDRAIVRNLARVPWPYGVGDAEQFLALPQEPARPRFLVFLRDSAELVGCVGLHGDADAELGYWFARAHWGKGLATEAGQAVIDLADASLRLPRLISSHAVDNPASGRVLAKLGFRPTGGYGLLPSLGRGCDLKVRLFARERGSVERDAEPMAA
jgi:RimJ/RimL family protein N-acetyltransferase